MDTPTPNNKVLVVNGQHLNLESCGGAGRYGEQLYNKMTAPENAEEFNGCDVHHLSFQELIAHSLNASQGNRRSFDSIKHVISRCCPPVIFDYAVQFYQSLSERAASEDRKKESSLAPYPLWFRSESSVLLHELTNYSMCDELGRLSLCKNLKLVVSFLDIQDYYYPEYFRDASLASRRRAYSFYKDRAEFFIAISEFTKQTMVERLDIDSEKIKVIHLAADDMLLLQMSQDVKDWVSSFGRFWIYPAKPWKHKNHDFLFKSLAARKDELKRAGIKLLLTGGFSEEDLKSFNNSLHDYSLGNIVHILGFVTDERLQALLRHAEFLVFPSLFEGFGMPILEAMTLGCPVLSSNAGSLPEVGGDAALYFDPECKEDFIALIDAAVIGNSIDREAMIERGFMNCKRFSWDKTYRETVDVYKTLL